MKLDFEYGTYKTTLDLRRKFTVLHDLSGTGKTHFARGITSLRRDARINVVAYIEVSDIPTIPDDVDVVVVDESVITLLNRERALSSFLTADKLFVIISRNAIKCINYSYVDIYIMDYIDNRYCLKRKYPDLNKLNFVPDYTEDSGAGLDYYKQFYPNMESTFGKDNIINTAPVNSNIVADGCSIGSVITDIYDKYNWFLPESFEWLILRKHGYVPDVSRVHNAEDTYHASRVNLPFKYTKKKLTNALQDRKYISDFEVTDDYLLFKIKQFGCDFSLEDLRATIYNITGDYDTEQVILIALITLYLDKVK